MVVTASADKRGSKRRKIDPNDSGGATLYLASTADEDRIALQRQSERTARRNVIEEWFAYRLIDTDTFERTRVYVCENCIFKKQWLRELEPSCTAQDFRRLMREPAIVNPENAQRFLQDAIKPFAMRAPSPPPAPTPDNAKDRLKKRMLLNSRRLRDAIVKPTNDQRVAE